MPSLTLYKQILENLTQSVVLLDADLKLIYLNPAAEMLFESSARRITGLSLDQLIPAKSELLSIIRDGLKSSHSFTQHEVTVILPGHRAVGAAELRRRGRVGQAGLHPEGEAAG